MGQRYSVLWFGVDDSTFTVRAPFYGVSTRVPLAWDDGNCTTRDDCREQMGLPGTIQKFSLQSMFWVTNMIANYAYSRYDDIAPAIFSRLAATESHLQAAVTAQDAALMMLPESAAREAATNFSFVTAEALHREWLDFYGELFVTYVDGYKMVHGAAPGSVKKVGSQLRNLMRAAIASQTGSKYRLPGRAAAGDGKNLAAIDKRQLRAMGRRHEAPEEDEVWDGDLADASLWSSFRDPVRYIAFATLLSVGSFGLGIAVASQRRVVVSTALLEPLA